LASAHLAQGNYPEAKHYAESAYATASETQDRWFLAYCLIEMGNVAAAMQDYVAARRYFDESYAIRKEFNDPEGMAVALNYLGEVALHQEQFAEARSTYERSVALYRDINDRGGLARSLNGLGSALCNLEDYESARHHLNRALRIADEIQFVSLMCTILTSIGHLLVNIGHHAHGMKLLAQISRHPSSTTTCKAHARQLLAQHREIVAQEIYDIAMAQDGIASINARAEMAESELQESELTSQRPASSVAKGGPLLPIHAASPSLSSRVATTGQPLVEPLTPRELEILNLIVEGLSNQQIASSLFITRGTVKWYTSQIYSKLGIDSRIQAIGRARELSLVS
jgi:ATP/maltotriose-dependent transcriptional regulator MalT